MQFQDGSLNWGFILFVALLLAVISLWCHVLRAVARLSRCHRRRARRSREQFMSTAAQPLLGKAYLQPLAPEKPMAERPCPIEVRPGPQMHVSFTGICQGLLTSGASQMPAC